MKEYIDLIMGLVSGVVLMFLNNSIVHDSMNKILTGFNPTNIKNSFIISFISKSIIILSFIGIVIIVIYSILILKKSIKNKFIK